VVYSKISTKLPHSDIILTFLKDLLQRKYVQHVQGQNTESFPSTNWINI